MDNKTAVYYGTGTPGVKLLLRESPLRLSQELSSGTMVSKQLLSKEAFDVRPE